MNLQGFKFFGGIVSLSPATFTGMPDEDKREGLLGGWSLGMVEVPPKGSRADLLPVFPSTSKYRSVHTSFLAAKKGF